MSRYNLILIGLNYKTAAVEEREKALAIFRALPGILLATCNRVELYQVETAPIHRDRFPYPFYYYVNEQAVGHLFRVASGLDSQILGEWEILGQVREAYLRAKGKPPFLDHLFERAIEVGRRVREETRISRGNVSIASVAIAKAREKLKGIADRKIILIGVGKVSEVVLKTLLKMSLNLILVANRTYEKAYALTEKFGGKAVRFDELERELTDADLLISSTAAPHLILKKKQIMERKKPLVIIDLAVPRDVDPKVVEIPGVTLLNIDDIKEEINFNLARRKIEAVFAERIVEEEVEKFCERFALEHAAAA